MKLVIKIFNFVIIGIAALATILLFVLPTFSFNSNIALDVEKFSKFVPETTYTRDIDIVNMLGTDEIHVGIKFKLYPNGVASVMDGNKEKIDERIIIENTSDILDVLHEPVDLIADFSIRSVLKSTIKAEITKQVTEAKNKAGSPSSAQDIMDDVGMDDAYFTNFAFALYDSANSDTATVDSVSATLYAQIDDALAKAEESGAVDTSAFAEQQKATTRENMLQILNQLEMVNSDDSIKKISDLPYMYLAKYVKKALQGEVKDSELEQKSGESTRDYSDRLLSLFVVTEMPDGFYKIVGYISLGLFIGLFIFAATWLFLGLYTAYRVFIKKKEYTIFGFWFYVAGLLQIVLGLGLTVVCKFMLPKIIDFGATSIPLKSVIIAPRTCALATSIVFLVTVGIAIAYLVLKILNKKNSSNKEAK